LRDRRGSGGRDRGLAQGGRFLDVRIAVKPASREYIAEWAAGQGVENYVVSATIEARKPG
jgi:hypothetical protein